MRRLPVKYADGSIDLIEIEGIFYLEAQGEDTLIRTKRKKPYKSIQRLGELAKKLPAPAFVRCHREFIVNFNRVRSIAPRKSRGYDLRLDPSSLWQATPRHARLRSDELRRAKPTCQPPYPHRPEPTGRHPQNPRPLSAVASYLEMNRLVLLDIS